ncbi:MAG: fluoride efflux transporter CrcB [Gammaproteobacteria bacterium]|nr:MAG: fluoride efflux transporter CrcB [Gammaproteobacteria bacterium]
MNQYLCIAAGGATGALFRFAAANWVHAVLGRDFPWGTLAVNVSGSLAMGFLYVLLFERTDADALWRAGLLIGFLGAFTTFSSFSIETLTLIEAGGHLRAAANILFSVALCLGGCWLGMVIGRNI